MWIEGNCVLLMKKNLKEIIRNLYRIKIFLEMVKNHMMEHSCENIEKSTKKWYNKRVAKVRFFEKGGRQLC